MTETVRNNERHIALAGASNLRDLGGYVAADGRTTRWGQLYRSGSMAGLKDTDWAWMKERGIATVCDLRSDQERILAPTVWGGRADVRHIGPPYDSKLVFGRLPDPGHEAQEDAHNVNEMAQPLYLMFAELLAPSYREMFEALLDGHVPLIVHCSAGQDRTGVAVGLVLTALGIPRPVICEDYLLSTQYRRTHNEMDRQRMLSLVDSNIVARFYKKNLDRRGEAALKPRPLVTPDGKPLLLLAFHAIESRWGSVEGYLEQELSVAHSALEKLRNTYLSPKT